MNTGTPEHNTHGAKHYAHTGTPIRLTKTGKPERQYCFIAHVQLAFFWLRVLRALFIGVDLLSSKMEEIGKKTVEELGLFFPLATMTHICTHVQEYKNLCSMHMTAYGQEGSEDQL